MKTIEVISLIYKSPEYLNFITTQLRNYATSFDGYDVSWRIVGNNPSTEIRDLLDQASYPVSIIDHPYPDYYLNWVYRAYNYSVETSNADMICLVNSDMAFSPNWLSNLARYYTPKHIVTSRLVESGKMVSGLHGVSQNFGRSPQGFDQEGFESYAKNISQPVAKPGGLFMPLLISRDIFLKAGKFPEGNIYTTGVGRVNGQFVCSGDAYFFYNILRDKWGVHHITAFDSIVYHIQEGEKDE